MSEIMTPIPFEKLLKWMMREYETKASVFGVSKEHFYRPQKPAGVKICDETLASPLGAAAGPNTQLAQNIVAAFLGGFRFMELKTVQTMDGEALRNCIGRPCISAEKEGYNCEWSTELTVQQAFEEYAKAWVLVHIAAREFGLIEAGKAMFNISVGYDFDGITSEKIDTFIESILDASRTTFFPSLKAQCLENLSLFKNVTAEDILLIPNRITNSITLSTLHGCPPEEIEKIASYLIKEKKMDTFIKLNPTLLGYDRVRQTLDSMGYTEIDFDHTHFDQDLKYADAVPMIARLKELAEKYKVSFGVKLTNTFPVKAGGLLPAEYMYMSGKALYPLSIQLAALLAEEFKGNLSISYSGGADAMNVDKIFAAGIKPITVATTILKPGGYARGRQMSALCEGVKDRNGLDVKNLKALAETAVRDAFYGFNAEIKESKKNESPLPLLNCYIAPCSETGCPIHQQIPVYLDLAKKGDYQKAFEVVVNDNVLPSITGEICNHHCQTKCNRVDYDTPVQIRSVKKLIAEKAQDAYIDALEPAKLMIDKKVGIVGAGPGGVAVASYLRRNGVSATVIEKESVPMGVVGHVVPRFRIDQKLVDRDYRLAQKYGVEFKFNTAWDGDIQTLKKEYDYVVLATGAYAPGANPLAEGKEHVVDALDFLMGHDANPDSMKTVKHVGVIGGGNVAMDCARAAKRWGTETVSIIYRRTQRYMPADAEELALANAEGITMLELLAPKSYDGKTLVCEVMRLGERGADGRRGVAGTGDTKELNIDYLIAATGSRIEKTQFTKNAIEMDEKGGPKTNAAMETSISNVYAVGDCRKGPDTIVGAMADGKAAAKDILKKLGLKNDFKTFACADAAEKEAVRGILNTSEKPEEQGRRCFGCDEACRLCVDVCPNRANQMVKLADGTEQIVHIDGMCNECGNCTLFCPHNGRPYKDKLTLYWSEADFTDSANQGFYIQPNGGFLFRMADTPVFETVLDDKRVPADVWAVVKRILSDYDYWVI